MAKPMQNNLPQRILIIKVRAMGDTLLATPAIRAIHTAYPRAHITVLVSKLGQTVLARNPHINEIKIYEKTRNWLQGVKQLQAVRHGGYDMVIALHASFRTALLALATRAPVRVVHNHSGYNFFSTLPIQAEKKSKSAIERDLDAIRALGINPVGTELVFPLQESDFEAMQQILLEKGISGGEPYWVLVPGAGKNRKTWSASAVAAFLNEVRHHVDGKWIVLAGPAEKNLVAEVILRVKQRPIILSLDIYQAGALMSLSHGVVTTDSGPKHVAAAVGARTLTLWTDEPEAEWHPYDREQHIVLRSRTGLVSDITAEEVCKELEDHFGDPEFHHHPIQ